jgi:hypothetical protein
VVSAEHLVGLRRFRDQADDSELASALGKIVKDLEVK